jgi:predicted small integral membrane protein
MIVRLSKCALLLAVAFFFSLVVFNNTTDYNSNYQFVHHVLSMDTTFPGNHGMWRALPSPALQTVFYGGIISWETIIAVLSWWGAIRLLRLLRSPATAFQRAKSISIAGLTLGCLLWFVAFISVGGEWFLMWQSKIWNGQDAAFRMFTVLFLILLYTSAPEHDPPAVDATLQ